MAERVPVPIPPPVVSAPPPAPPVVAGTVITPSGAVPAHVENVWNWAKGYIRNLGWALAPVWLSVDSLSPTSAAEAEGLGIKGCCCPDGEGCSARGKHLVAGLGVAKSVEDVEKVWPVTNPHVKAGHVGIGVLTGSESKLLVLDVGSAFGLTRTRFKVADHVLTQQTPTGGEHWFFQLEPGEAVLGGRSEIELVTDCLVLGDGTFVVLGPRHGYQWVGGPKVLVEGGITEAPEALRLRLSDKKLLAMVKDIHRDDPWRTAPGTPLHGVQPRTFSRQGDIRRVVDEYGHKVTFTPGLGWKVWTENGWGGPERSAQMLKSMVADLPAVHRREGHAANDRGDSDMAKDAKKWAVRAQARSSASLLSDLESDDRILVPSVRDWDAEGWIAGLPVKAGVGRLVNLNSGHVEMDARTRRVSRMLGAEFVEGPGGSFDFLWERASEGGSGKWFYRYVKGLEGQMGPENLRLLQRAAGASMYGRRGVDGDTDAVFVLKGPPRCGKSTFSEILLAVSGQYGKAMSHNLIFGDKGNPEFSTAAIAGYRVLTFSEPPMKVELNTTALKALSGGDSMTGRLPYGREEISFIPECSLWLMTNHPLEIADDAIWRRLKFFPFEHSIAEGAILPKLREMVTGDPAELQLALAWMLQGSVAWGREGWGDTAAWRETVADEKSKHNVIDKWAADCLEVTLSVTDEFSPAEMMVSFNSWMAMSGEDAPPLSKAGVREELERHCITQRVTYNRHRARFVGGRLA